MSGRAVAIFLIICAALAGGAIYYFQVYAYYQRLGAGDVDIKISRGVFAGSIEARNLQAINSDSSPIRFRACFEATGSITVGASRYSDPVPLQAPIWFSCFKAGEIGADLRAGAARAFLGEANVTYGVDRVLAIYSDGRGYAWQQLNPCGTALYNGRPLPADCPPPN